MSNQNSKELRDMQKKTLGIHREVEQMRTVLKNQLKVDAGKASYVRRDASTGTFVRER